MPAPFDIANHENIKLLAEAICRAGGTEFDRWAKAYLELVEARGLPKPLICHPSIQLVSGVYFDFSSPETSPFPIEDIAHALSKLCRYNGHTRGPDIYSIAQHSVLASRNAPDEFKFDALMHDAHEFVVGDMTSPMKQLCPDFKQVEKRTEKALANNFQLRFPMPAEVKIVDIRMAATEKRDVMPFDPKGADGWTITKGYEPYPEIIEPWDYQTSRRAFLDAFTTLQPLHIQRLKESA